MISKDYSQETRLLVAVDCIIFGFDDEELKLLLIKRDFDPEKGKWSLMGGFLKENEGADQAAARVLLQLTGLHDVYMDQVRTYTHPDRDPGERTISIAYYALINIQSHKKELIEQHSAQWFGLSEIPDLIFDHRKMVKDAITQLRYMTSIRPVGFELLPAKFTMRQLQKLYEAIFDEALDKRNFNRKISQMNILVKLEEKDRSSSKKGSFLFKFDLDKYRAKVLDGFSFKV